MFVCQISGRRQSGRAERLPQVLERYVCAECGSRPGAPLHGLYGQVGENVVCVQGDGRATGRGHIGYDPTVLSLNDRENFAVEKFERGLQSIRLHDKAGKLHLRPRLLDPLLYQVAFMLRTYAFLRRKYDFNNK